jgi:hypothetical protein
MKFKKNQKRGEVGLKFKNQEMIHSDFQDRCKISAYYPIGDKTHDKNYNNNFSIIAFNCLDMLEKSVFKSKVLTLIRLPPII